MKRSADFNVYWEMSIDETKRCYTVSLRQDFIRGVTHVILVHEFTDKQQAKDFFTKMMHAHVRPSVRSRNGYVSEGYNSVAVPHDPIHHRSKV